MKYIIVSFFGSLGPQAVNWVYYDTEKEAVAAIPKLREDKPKLSKTALSVISISVP